MTLQLQGFTTAILSCYSYTYISMSSGRSEKAKSSIRSNATFSEMKLGKIQMYKLRIRHVFKKNSLFTFFHSFFWNVLSPSPWKAYSSSVWVMIFLSSSRSTAKTKHTSTIKYVKSGGFWTTIYSHIFEPREAGEGKRTDALQHVVLRYDARVRGSTETPVNHTAVLSRQSLRKKSRMALNSLVQHECFKVKQATQNEISKIIAATNRARLHFTQAHAGNTIHSYMSQGLNIGSSTDPTYYKKNNDNLNQYNQSILKSKN